MQMQPARSRRPTQTYPGLYEAPRTPSRHRSKSPNATFATPHRRDPTPDWGRASLSRASSTHPPILARTQRSVSRGSDRRKPLSTDDVEQWELLRQQGLILRGSSSAHPAAVARNEVSIVSTLPQSFHTYHTIANPPQSISRLRSSTGSNSSMRLQKKPTAVFARPSLPLQRLDIPLPLDALQVSRDGDIDRRTEHTRTSTLQSSSSRHAQLRADNTFLYERPSKASYIERENTAKQVEMQKHLAAVSRSRPITPVATRNGASRRSSLAPRRSVESLYSIYAGSPSRTVSPAQHSALAYLQSPNVSYGIRRASAMEPRENYSSPSQIRNRRSSAHHSSPAWMPPTRELQSSQLSRQETEASFYSQTTMREVYPAALVPSSRPSSRASARSYAMDTSVCGLDDDHGQMILQSSAMTPRTLSTAQLLWHDLYEELLAEDSMTEMHPGYSEHDNPIQKSPQKPQKIVSSADFIPPSPVAVAPLRHRKTMRRNPSETEQYTSPTRPPLLRRSEPNHVYGGHEEHADRLIKRARKSVEETSMQSTTSSPVKLQREIQPLTASQDLLAHKPLHEDQPHQSPVPSPVGQLAAKLRSKRISDHDDDMETYDFSALDELARRSAPSEAGEENGDMHMSITSALTETDQQQSAGEVSATKLDPSASNFSKDDSALRDASLSKAQEAKPRPANSHLQGIESVRRPLAAIVRSSTRIPAPTARKFAGKIYANRIDKPFA